MFICSVAAGAIELGWRGLSVGEGHCGSTLRQRPRLDGQARETKFNVLFSKTKIYQKKLFSQRHILTFTINLPIEI